MRTVLVSDLPRCVPTSFPRLYRYFIELRVLDLNLPVFHFHTPSSIHHCAVFFGFHRVLPHSYHRLLSSDAPGKPCIPTFIHPPFFAVSVHDASHLS